jgi:hypothetical protein
VRSDGGREESEDEVDRKEKDCKEDDQGGSQGKED